MPKISVVLAVFNEEKNLGACLDSVKDLADEIIIVDGGSTDKTVEIAKKYGAKVQITNNPPNFHINKQKAIDMAGGDWILQLDADERASTELKEEIRSTINHQPSTINGFWMPRKNYFLGRFLTKGGQYPDYTLRFYKKGKGRLPQKDVHEQAVVEGKIGYLKNPLIHIADPNFSRYLLRFNRYTDLMVDEFKNKKMGFNPIMFIKYLLILPIWWFLLTYVRHKGFVDSWQGFVFSFFSALRFPISCLKYLGWYKVSVIFILLFSAILRFYNFPVRWGLGGDDGRDAMIALEAIKRHELPLIGSFSSAGPFVFGPLFYWFIMLSYLILPFFISAPWIFTGTIGVSTVFVIIYLAKLIGGEKLAIIGGILAATSPQLMVRSLMLGQHSFIPIFAALLVMNFLLLWQRRKQRYAFFMGLSLGAALSMHYQAINLLIFFPAILFITNLNIKNRLSSLLLMFLGFLIPSLPMIYWDAHQGFANIRNVLDYLLIGQYRIYVPNSWRLFIFDYIPSYWSFVIGTFSIVAFLLALSSALFFLGSIAKKKISKEFLLLGIIFFTLLLVNKYYRGERSEGYLLYFVPLILIFSSFLIKTMFEFRQKLIKILGLIVLMVTIFSNFVLIKDFLDVESNVRGLVKTSNALSKKYPNKKFSLYDYRYKMYIESMSLSLILSYENKTSNNGVPLGFGCYGKGCPSGYKTVLKSPILLLDLKGVDPKLLQKKNKIWVNVNQSSVYDDLIGWSKSYSLKSTFSLKNYIMEKLR